MCEGHATGYLSARRAALIPFGRSFPVRLLEARISALLGLYDILHLRCSPGKCLLHACSIRIHTSRTRGSSRFHGHTAGAVRYICSTTAGRTVGSQQPASESSQ
eukprot:1269382-Pleurochrysis_carterae.AAC.1